MKAWLWAAVEPVSRARGVDPISYAFDPATLQFTLVYAPRSVSGPTTITVPMRTYEAGYQVDCNGCTYHRDRDTLVIDTPPEQSPATITLKR